MDPTQIARVFCLISLDRKREVTEHSVCRSGHTTVLIRAQGRLCTIWNYPLEQLQEAFREVPQPGRFHSFDNNCGMLIVRMMCNLGRKFNDDDIRFLTRRLHLSKELVKGDYHNALAQMKQMWVAKEKNKDMDKDTDDLSEKDEFNAIKNYVQFSVRKHWRQCEKQHGKKMGV